MPTECGVVDLEDGGGRMATTDGDRAEVCDADGGRADGDQAEVCQAGSA